MSTPVGDASWDLVERSNPDQFCPKKKKTKNQKKQKKDNKSPKLLETVSVWCSNLSKSNFIFDNARAKTKQKNRFVKTQKNCFTHNSIVLAQNRETVRYMATKPCFFQLTKLLLIFPTNSLRSQLFSGENERIYKLR